jgi:hypothetical protein
MTYALAKELRDAGLFSPLHSGDDDCVVLGCYFPEDWGDEFQRGVLYHCPTLSELIEVCGEVTVTISQEYVANPDSGGANQKWFAGVYNFHDHEWVQVYGGPTPEEAVARLWLALNAKRTTEIPS